jgi:hypothetical protein
VSIYLPKEHGAPQSAKNRTRSKNLIRRAGKQLRDSGLRRTEAEALLEPIQNLFDDPETWKKAGEGLAVFSGRGRFEAIHEPVGFDDRVVVGSRFHLIPLLRVAPADGRFFILALSQKRARLAACTRGSAAEIPVPGLPRGLEDLLGPRPRKQLQLHTWSGNTNGNGVAFHGQGMPPDADKDRIAKYLSLVERAVSRRLAEDSAPLVLAGVDYYLLPLYRQTNRYRHLIDKEIRGNPDRTPWLDLLRMAWPLVEPEFVRPQRRAAKEVRALASKGAALSRLPEVLQAAAKGRIDKLYVSDGIQVLGRFEPSDGSVHIDRVPTAEDEDLLNLAAVETLAHGGEVVAVAASDMPETVQLCGVPRY